MRITGLFNTNAFQSVTAASGYPDPAGSHGYGLARWDPRLKLALLAAAVSLNVTIARPWLSVVLFLTGLGLAFWSRLPPRRFLLFFLAPAWATLLVFIGFSIGFGTSPLFSIGAVQVYREGIFQGLSAAARVACDMTWLAVFFLTTPFVRILKALKWFRVPEVLIDVIATAYRYAFLLVEEFFKMRDIARIKGGFDTYLKACRSTAMILAQVILRAYDRSLRIEEAMTARGATAPREKDPMNYSAETPVCPNRCDITPVFMEDGVPVLSCSGMWHSYKGDRSIKNVSLTVEKGDVVVLCGPNGSGKTTLLKLFAGILVPEKGDIFLYGKNLDGNTRKAAYRRVALLLQDPNDQLFCTHVREDIAFGPLNLGLEAEEIDRLVNTAMELMEVAHLADRPIHRLSHGEMKRVGLAGLIAMRPPLILLDEPTASLDPASANHLVSLIRHLNSHHGYTLVVVTHDIDLAAMIASRVVVLNEGEIMADGLPREVLSNKQLLDSARLEPPMLTQLFQQVFSDSISGFEIPLTVTEAVTLLRSR
ncbi:MAG: cobalt ECF transporter T component CbiQ [Desulfobacterales bacterium]